MPRLQDIERFKQDLRPLGHEEELLKKWNETLVDIAPPERAPGEGPSQAFEEGAAPVSARVPDFSALDRRPAPPSPAPAEDVSSSEDVSFDEFLGGIDLDHLGESSTSASLETAEPGTSVPTESVDADFLSALADLGGAPPAATEAPGAPEPRAIEPGAIDLGGFEIEALPGETGAEAAPEGGPGMVDHGKPASPLGDGGPAESGADETAGLLAGLSDELSSGDFGAGFGETAAEAEEPENAPSGAGGFELPGLGDDLFGVGAAEPETETEPVATTGGPGEEAPSDLEALPELGEIDLGGDVDFFGLDKPTSGMQAAQSAPKAPDAFETNDDFGAAFGLGGAPDFNAEPEPAPESPDFFGGDGSFGADDFTISELDSRDHAPRKKPEPEAPRKKPEKKRREPEAPLPEGAVKPVSLSDEQVDDLQDSLLGFPLNLRLAVEDIIANIHGTDEQRARLVWMLVEGDSAAAVADWASRILKRPIELPKGYEKRTGAAFEAERGSFPYLFVHTILPMAGMILGVLAAALCVLWLGYTFVWRPIQANSWYARGYERVRDDAFAEAEEHFGKADKVWPMKPWYYRYARAYVAKHRYELAAEKYERLLARWPSDDAAAIEWARLEKDEVYDYAEAARILREYVLDRDYYNKDALLLLGDSWLDWAEEDPLGDKPDKFEEARVAYASLVQKYGQKDPYLERMLRYFIRLEQGRGVDKSDQILALKAHFTDTWKARISAETLTELGGYLIDRDLLQDVRKILMRSADLDRTIPATHYQMSRYYRLTDNPDEERKALSNAVITFEAKENLRSRDIGRYVDALNWSGEYYVRTGEVVTAETFFEKARARYERAVEERRLARNRRYGAIYANLADIRIAHRDDYAGALRLFAEAVLNGYDTPLMHYQRGYIYYAVGSLEDPAKAVEHFYRAGLDIAEDRHYLDYAIANALYRREDYFAARSYYETLAERLRSELERLDAVAPQTRDVHHELVQLLMFTDNNLGAALYKAAERTGNPSLRGAAMAAWTESLELWDAIDRDAKTMLRPGTRAAAATNIDAVTHPRRGIDIVIERLIPKRMEFPQGWAPYRDSPAQRK